MEYRVIITKINDMKKYTMEQSEVKFDIETGDAENNFENLTLNTIDTVVKDTKINLYINRSNIRAPKNSNNQKKDIENEIKYFFRGEIFSNEKSLYNITIEFMENTKSLIKLTYKNCKLKENNTGSDFGSKIGLFYNLNYETSALPEYTQV